MATLLQILLPLLPWLLIFVFLWFFIFRRLRVQHPATKQQTERAFRHGDSVEAKLNRIIELLERRDKQ